MRGLSGMESIAIPEGWNTVAFFGRLISEKVCAYEYLRSPETPVRNVFEALRMLDFHDYCVLKARKAEANNAR